MDAHKKETSHQHKNDAEKDMIYSGAVLGSVDILGLAQTSVDMCHPLIKCWNMIGPIATLGYIMLKVFIYFH